MEPQSSSILGLNWNVDTDSLIVCHGTEQEAPAKITQRIVFYSKAFGQQWDKHGAKSCQQNTQNGSVIGALSSEK